jgi:hypothetical protein
VHELIVDAPGLIKKKRVLKRVVGVTLLKYKKLCGFGLGVFHVKNTQPYMTNIEIGAPPPPRSLELPPE